MRSQAETPPLPAPDRSLLDVFRKREGSPEDRPPGSRPGRGRRREVAGEDQERLILAALHDLRDTTVREVMTPRVDVVGLPIPVQAADVARAVRQTGHSSFPVYDDDLDHLIGILFVNDLFRSGWELDARNGNGGGEPDKPTPLDISRRAMQTLFALLEPTGIPAPPAMDLIPPRLTRRQTVVNVRTG